MESDNRGKAWTSVDKHRLQKMVDDGVSMKKMARELGRTECAVKCRLEDMNLLSKVMSRQYAEKPKENTMESNVCDNTKPLRIEDVTLINGRRKEDMTPAALLALVRQENRHIEDLESVGGGSSYLMQQINKHRANIDALLKILDELHAK